MDMKEVFGFYKGRRVLVTGHTGFKGAWLCKMLFMAGADVTGYALCPPTEPNLFGLCGTVKHMNSVIGDICDLHRLEQVFRTAKPEIVIHMAAQPIVRYSYENPVETYRTNVMGTVNVLECVRKSEFVRSFVNVTTDKVYENHEWAWGYREDDRLDGFDPYSNSKSCSELITGSYMRSFLQKEGIAVSTLRAGNVIGGGDFAADRIIPDCVRAIKEDREMIVRNPYSVRPYQHVLEALFAYLMVAKEQYQNPDMAGCYNIGPDDQDCWTTGELVDCFLRLWNSREKSSILWRHLSDGNVCHEAGFLKLDCSKAKAAFGWKPMWHLEEALERVVEWTQAYMEREDIERCMESQIREYILC